jgi:predicted negative regulator of RcsB-dependent stress response
MIPLFALVSLAVWSAAPVLAAVRTAEQETKIVDGFIEAVKANKEFAAEPAQKAVDAATALKTEEEGRPVAITEGLRELYPAFSEALKALGEENLEGARTSLTDLSSSSDPYLAAEASYFLARVQLLREHYEEALPLLDAVETKYADQSMRAGEALFLKGVAQAQMLKRKDAIVSLERYLNENPGAPERMKVGAWRQLEQLKLVEDGTLSDVFTRMDFSRRRLALEDSGNGTQTEQKKIISILDQLIKEAEDRECNCKGSGKGQKKGQKQGKSGEGEGEGSAQGKGGQGGQSGGGSKGTDGAAAERLHRGGPQSPWSQLRDKDRDPVYNAIKQKFPGRYQQLIEQYYKSFQEESEEG